MIKILFTIPNFDTAGSGKALLNIATRLDRENFTPEILCKHDRGAFFQTVKSSGIKVHIFDYETPMRPFLKGVWGCWKVSRRLRKINPDIIHSFHYSADYSEVFAARFAGIKWVFTKKNMSWGGYSKNGWRLRTGLADGIIAQNTDMLRDFFPGWEKVDLIPRGVDIQLFAPKYPDVSIFDGMANMRLIVCIANLVPVKGVEVLLQAFGYLNRDFPEVRLAIIGDNESEYGKILQSKALSIAPEQIIFTGKISNVQDYLRTATIFILPTLRTGRQEGSPVALLEAMATGLPVIASNVAGIRDQLRQCPELMFEPGNAEALAEKIRVLLNLPVQELKALGMSLRKEAVENFSIEQEVALHAHFYQKVYKKII